MSMTRHKVDCPPLGGRWRSYHVFPIAGTYYHQSAARRIVQAALHGRVSEVFAVREPNNPHDPNAISIRVKRWFGMQTIGYVPAELAEDITDCGIGVPIEVGLYRVGFDADYPDDLEIAVRLSLPKKGDPIWETPGRQSPWR